MTSRSLPSSKQSFENTNNGYNGAVNEKEVVINSTIIAQVRKSSRARNMRITVRTDGTVRAVQPARVGYFDFMRFLTGKAEWIKEKVDFFKAHPVTKVLRNRHTKREYALYRVQARKLAEVRLAYFNEQYGFSYKKIFIRNQKTRWGSCSSKGNLNFNYKIALLPSHLADYVIVHELCHLGELNHSKRFWDLVARTMPDYKGLKKELLDNKDNIL